MSDAVASFDDPFTMFADAFARAKAREPFEVEAMTLATVDEDGLPSARIVLLKGFDERGFVFYTNRTSRKGKALLANPRCALCLHWPKGQEQVRIEGDVSLASDEESDAYFQTRHPTSRLGAWASLQSQPLPEKAVLDARMAEMTTKFADGNIPRPPHWGGYRVDPTRVEFWFGRPSRLHDRVLFTRDGSKWTKSALFP